MRVEAPPTFVNDVIVTKRAAYFTDSQRPQLYVLKLGRGGRLPASAETLPVTGLPASTGFQLNGIEATHRRLIAVHSALGKLFEIDPRNGAAEEIELEGGDAANGDGLLLHGGSGGVVEGQEDPQVAAPSALTWAIRSSRAAASSISPASGRRSAAKGFDYGVRPARR